MDWTEEKTVQFIEDYRKHPVLWQSSNLNYKNRNMRRDAVAELSTKYGVDEKLAVNKIKSVRSYFRKEHARVMKKKSSAAADEAYTSGWFGYKPLLFILDGDAKGKGKGTKTITKETQGQGDESQESCTPRDEAVTDVFSEPSIPKAKKKKTANEVDEAQTILHTVREKLDKDEYHFKVFCDYTASRIRRLNNPYLQGVAERRINAVMSEIENMESQPFTEQHYSADINMMPGCSSNRDSPSLSSFSSVSASTEYILN